jgi:uncharacterized protein (TIGR02453 family)
MTFDGFSDHTFRFLRAIARDNSRATFAAQRAAYDEHYVGAASEFVQAAKPLLQRLAPELVADARVDRSIVRLHRDARFVGDGPPYKEQLELWFWEGDRRVAVSQLTLVLTPRGVRVGAGARGLRGPSLALAAYRAALAEPAARVELERIVRSLERSGFELTSPEVAASARGATPREAASGSAGPAGAAQGLARRRALVASAAFERALAQDAELVPRCIAVWKRLLPLHRWLVEHVQAALV